MNVMASSAMPEREAISTTKRKFYKALESLDAVSNPLAAKPAAKRIRRSTSSTKPVIVPAARQDGTLKDPPNFSPWSHETFLQRLKTFSRVSQWHPKPEAVNEVAWAKRGWTCVDVNTVACKGGCERRIVVGLESSRNNRAQGRQQASEEVEGEVEQVEEDEAEQDEEDHASLENALVQRYSSIIVNGHLESCLWREAGCKDDIYRLQVVRPAVWQPEVRKRYTSLLGIRQSIQQITTKGLPHDTPNSSSSPAHLLQSFSQDLLPAPPPPPSPETSAIALEIALHGWRGAQHVSNDLLQCDACSQRIGLWMYQPGYKPTHSSLYDAEAEEPMTIDLVEMHRDHCPWRNAETQQASGSLSGLNACQILQRVVTTWAREQRRRSDELRKAALAIPLGEDEDDDGDVDGTGLTATPLSRAEIAEQDKERESRLRRLKNIFTIKRRSTARPVGHRVG